MKQNNLYLKIASCNAAKSKTACTLLRELLIAKYDVLLIREPYLLRNEVVNFPGYRIYRSETGSRCAIVCRPSLPVKLLSAGDSNGAILITYLKGTIALTSIYLHKIENLQQDLKDIQDLT